MLKPIPVGAVIAVLLTGGAVAGPNHDAYAAYQRDDHAIALKRWRPLTGAGRVVAQNADCLRRDPWNPKLRAQECGDRPIQHRMTNVSIQSKYLFGREGETRVYARLSEPEGQGPNPAVVLLHTCGGFTPHVYRDWTDFLTGLGYVVLSVDSYGARGARNCTELERVFQTGRSHYDARRKAVVSDAYGALDYLTKLPFVDGNRVAVMGFSAGANAINYKLVQRRLRSSAEPDFKAAISLYGRCHGLFDYSQGQIPAMQIVGDKDVGHVAECRQVGQRTPMDVHILPGVYHGFDSGAGRGMTMDCCGNEMLYDAGAVKKARELVKAFLTEHVAGTSKASAGDQLASAGDRFDGQWEGLIRCGSCENCLGPLEKNVNIKIESGRFELVPDATYKGKGAIDNQGNVRIRPMNYRIFTFYGTYDGEFIRLEGERGLRSCTIEFSRVTSPVEASN